MISGLFKQEREKGHYKKSSLSITSTLHPYTDERPSKLLAYESLFLVFELIIKRDGLDKCEMKEE